MTTINSLIYAVQKALYEHASISDCPRIENISTSTDGTGQIKISLDITLSSYGSMQPIYFETAEQRIRRELVEEYKTADGTRKIEISSRLLGKTYDD